MTKKDSLESFIRDHRSEFDHLKAPEHIWQKISRDSVQVHRFWKWSAVAATALLLIAIGYITGMQSKSNSSIAGWDEYRETEQYYQSRINQKMEIIKTLGVGNEVMEDIRVLDDVYYDLKTQLMEDPNADAAVLLNAMIRHQQQKLKVMEEILGRVDKYKTNENESQEM